MLVSILLLGLSIFVVLFGSSDEDAKVLFYPRETLESKSEVDEINEDKGSKKANLKKEDGESLATADVPAHRVKVKNSASPKKSTKGAAALARDIYDDLD